MVIFLVKLEMLGQVRYAVGQKPDLDFGRSGVPFV
jgi:hypothetical protein